MTPFGAKLRDMRAARGVSMKAMAEAIGVSPAYLSALEHGRRSTPTFDLLQRIITFFNVIWDEAEELETLAQVSHPRVTVDTAGLSPEATELANRLARHVHALEPAEIKAMLSLMQSFSKKSARR